MTAPGDGMYRRPTRDEIAARVKGTLPAAAPAQPPALRPEPAGDPVAWFGTHVAAALRARSWSGAEAAERAGMNIKTITRVLNGNGCGLDIAARLADLLGRDLATMVTPYACGTCHGQPPAGFSCLECGTERTAS